MAKSQYTAFPTFGGPKEGGGIMDVKLSPSQMRFPTARRPSQASKPAEVNPLAFLAPFLLQGIGSKLFGEKEIETPQPVDTNIDETFSLEDIRSELSSPEKAEAAAAELYGAKTKSTRGAKIGRAALNYLPALFLDDPRELSGFMSSTANIDKAVKAKEAQRSKFVGDYTNAMAGKVLNVTPAYSLDNPAIARNAIEGPNGGFYVQSVGAAEDATINGSKVKAGEYYRNPKWIIGEPLKSGASVKKTKDSAANAWTKIRDELETVETSMKSSLPMMNDIVENLITNPEVATWWQPLLKLGDQVQAMGQTFKDKGFEMTNNKENNWFDVTTGKPTEAFLTGKAMPYQKEVYDVSSNSMKTITANLDLVGIFGDAGNSAEFRTAIVNMAYLAAAANGQTGKNLSDKDLALHLEQLGATFGGSDGIKTPEAGIRAATSWYGNTLKSVSIKMQAHESNSLAADYRRENDTVTPWAERMISGQFITGNDGSPSRRQKLLPISAIWLREDDKNWNKYLNLLANAKYKYRGSDDTAVDNDPVSGIDWLNEYYNPYALMLDNASSLPKDPDGVVVPQPPKGRTGL